MAIAGVIAEYNPFHNGHRYQLERARAMTCAGAVVAVMSGEFVQRGEPAIVNKRLRAKWALQHGADLVLELPATFSLANAEGFARGAAGILHAAGMVTHLCFGCETDDLALLRRALAAKQGESPAFRAALREGLGRGWSYPRAQQYALTKAGEPPKIVAAISQPNSLLALEYLSALDRLGSGIAPVPVLRKDAQHRDEAVAGGIASASAIRLGLLRGDAAAMDAVPESVGADLAGLPPVTLKQLEQLILFAISRKGPEELVRAGDVLEGFENALARAGGVAHSLEQLLGALKSKRYTMARIKRILCRVLLDIDKEQLLLEPQYIRVLGIREERRDLLGELRERSSLPVLVRGEDWEDLPPAAAAQFAAQERAARTADLVAGVPHRPEARQRLVVV